MCVSFVKFIMAIYFSRKAFNSQNNYEKTNAVEEITGTPGVGKTTLTVVLVYLTGKATKRKLAEEYYINECRSLKRKWNDNSIFQEDLKETRYAKEYFENSSFYAHVFSNQSMKIEGKSVHKWTQEHSLGVKKVPPFSVEYVEEASSIYPTTMHADRVSEWTIDNRFKRHQVKTTYAVEQEVENINKDVRRVVGQTMEIESRISYLKPKFAIFIRAVLIKKGMKNNIKKGWYTDLFDRLGKTIEKVGVTEWTYYMMSGTESKMQRKPKKEKFTAFCDLPIEFDSRSFRNVPNTRDLSDFTEPEGYDNLVIGKDSKEADLMRNAFANITSKKGGDK